MNKKTIDFHARCEAVKETMRENGYEFSQFIYNDIKFEARLTIEDGEVCFKVFNVDDPSVTAYKTLNI